MQGADALPRGVAARFRKFPLGVAARFRKGAVPRQLPHVLDAAGARAVASDQKVNSLVGIRLRFRKEDMSLACDIEKMFHQFKVSSYHNHNLLGPRKNGETKESSWTNQTCQEKGQDAEEFHIKSTITNHLSPIGKITSITSYKTFIMAQDHRTMRAILLVVTNAGGQIRGLI